MKDNKSIALAYPASAWNKMTLFLTWSFLATVTLLLLVASAAAQTPAPEQDRPIALIGGTIHTISDGIIENGTILFEDGVITAIGTRVQVPAEAERIEVSGKEIYPGLVDAYSRMGIYEIGAVGMTVDISEEGEINPNVLAEVAFNPESRHIGTARTNGVLTAVTTPGGGLISGQSSAMMLDGWSWKDMVLQSGTAMIVNWPSPEDQEEYEEQLLELRDALANARTYHKAKLAYAEGDAPRFNSDTRLEAMDDVLNGDQPVVVEANDLRQIQDAITWAEEEGLSLIIMGGRDAHYVSHHLVSKDIPVIITEVLDSPDRNWEAYDSSYSLPSKLLEAGVTFAIAGGSSAPYTFRLRHEAGAAAAFGLSLEEALKAVTHSPAQILGFDHRVGSLEVGKDATLLITTGNPLEYSTQFEQAYIQGRDIDMTDAHRQLYQKYRLKVDRRAN